MKKPERQTYFLTLSGNAEGRISPGEIKYSLFIRLYKYPIPGLLLSRRFVQNHELALQLEDLTMHCEEIFASEIALQSGGSRQNHRRCIRASFCYNRTSLQSTAWRYCLGVRTEAISHRRGTRATSRRGTSAQQRPGRGPVESRRSD